MEKIADLRFVNLGEIDFENRQYRISFPSDEPSLCTILSKTGFISPVLLLQTKPYILIDGFRRVGYALDIGKKDVPACVLSVSPQEALLIAIYENFLRGLNVVEKATAVYKMFKLGFQKGDILKEMAKLGLGGSERILDVCLKIAKEDEDTKSYFVEHSLSIKTISYFLNFGKEEREMVISFLKGKKITESLLREFFFSFSVFLVKFGRPPYEELKTVKSLEEAIGLLKKKVSPTLSKLGDEFTEICAKMKLPPNAKVRVDPYFEKEEVEISIEAKRTEDIENALTKLQSALKRGDFHRIFELTSGSY